MNALFLDYPSIAIRTRQLSDTKHMHRAVLLALGSSVVVIVAATDKLVLGVVAGSATSLFS